MHILKLSGVHAKLATLKNTQKQVAQLILTSESHFLFALISNEHRLFVSKKKNEKSRDVYCLFYTKRLSRAAID